MSGLSSINKFLGLKAYICQRACQLTSDGVFVGKSVSMGGIPDTNGPCSSTPGNKEKWPVVYGGAALISSILIRASGLTSGEVNITTGEYGLKISSLTSPMLLQQTERNVPNGMIDTMTEKICSTHETYERRESQWDYFPVQTSKQTTPLRQMKS